MLKPVYKTVEKQWFAGWKNWVFLRTYHSQSVKKITSFFLNHSFAAGSTHKTRRFTQANFVDSIDGGGWFYPLSTNITKINKLKGFIK